MAATVGEAVYNRLLAINALTESAVGDRIYPQLATQEAEYPFVVYTVVGREDVRGLSGSRGLARHAVRVDVYAATESQASTLGSYVASGLPGQDAGAGIQGCFGSDADGSVTEDGIRVWSMTFDIWFVPT